MAGLRCEDGYGWGIVVFAGEGSWGYSRMPKRPSEERAMKALDVLEVGMYWGLGFGSGMAFGIAEGLITLVWTASHEYSQN